LHSNTKKKKLTKISKQKNAGRKKEVRNAATKNKCLHTRLWKPKSEKKANYKATETAAAAAEKL